MLGTTFFLNVIPWDSSTKDKDMWDEGTLYCLKIFHSTTFSEKDKKNLWEIRNGENVNKKKFHCFINKNLTLLF